MHHVTLNENDFTADYTAAQRTTGGHSDPQNPPGLKLLYCKVDVLYQMGKVFQVKLSTVVYSFHFSMVLFVLPLQQDRRFLLIVHFDPAKAIHEITRTDTKSS